MSVDNAIFLSASVPDPKRSPEFAKTANSVAITAAVRALVHVTLGRRVLIWGGHPAITPMVKVVAEEMGVDYGKWVILYQSYYFEDKFPEDNEKFNNVVYTKAVDGDREKSLLHMRERMFSEHKFGAAVFIGGMGGVIEECQLFKKNQPDACVVPVLSTGGAALKLADSIPKDALGDDLLNDLDYVQLFHRNLEISPREDRFPSPDSQPKDIEDRYWKPS